MPKGDGTGPDGHGPMTGRCMGFCIKEKESGESSYIGGGTMEGIRRWYGKARCRPLDSLSPEKDVLEKEKSFLLRRLELVEKELKKHINKTEEET
ncbi:MAG: DUF5320 domain-containing protein [Synergistaceae bacterium]|nr:DUF5320 domain-containing protein [Synergistaceae bacterium]